MHEHGIAESLASLPAAMSDEKPLPDEPGTDEKPAPQPIVIPDIRPALEPVCCGSGCPGCPNFG